MPVDLSERRILEVGGYTPYSRADVRANGVDDKSLAHKAQKERVKLPSCSYHALHAHRHSDLDGRLQLHTKETSRHRHPVVPTGGLLHTKARCTQEEMAGHCHPSVSAVRVQECTDEAGVLRCTRAADREEDVCPQRILAVTPVERRTPLIPRTASVKGALHEPILPEPDHSRAAGDRNCLSSKEATRDLAPRQEACRMDQVDTDQEVAVQLGLLAYSGPVLPGPLGCCHRNTLAHKIHAHDPLELAGAHEVDTMEEGDSHKSWTVQLHSHSMALTALPTTGKVDRRLVLSLLEVEEDATCRLVYRGYPQRSPLLDSALDLLFARLADKRGNSELTGRGGSQETRSRLTRIRGERHE